MAQLEDDTWYDFSAAVVLAAEIDTTAELAAFDVVILGDSGYSTADWTLFDAALEAWVQGGGGLVVTGFAARGTVCTGQPGVAAMLPVLCDSTVTTDVDVTVTMPDHPVVDETGSFSLTWSPSMDTSNGLGKDGLGLAVDADGDWVVAVRELGLGRVVYLAPVYMGSSYYGTSYLRSGDPDHLLEEAVAWAGGCQDLDADGGLDWRCGGDDCDDADATRFAGAAEACNQIDDDCDGIVPDTELDDDGDGLAECEGDCDDADAALNQDDVDGDGWSTCDGDCDDTDITWNLLDLDGDGYSNCTGDCDDVDDTLHPGAFEECNAVDDNCDGVVPGNEQDYDGDGYAECEGDCNDGDATLHPADEDSDGWSSCDGDCDDGDAALQLDDADGDGVSTCGGDCDDEDDASWPGAAEVCDGADNDCDGDVDDVDGDGDGFVDGDCGGDDCDDHSAAVHPADHDGDGFSPCDGDCDDGAGTVHPGAEEDCHNGVDDDCDGMVDGGDPESCPDPVVEPSTEDLVRGCGACTTGAAGSAAPWGVIWWIAAGWWMLLRRRA